MICFNKLWDLMRKKGVTKYQLSDRYGIADHTLRRLRDNASVRTSTLNKLCEILDCTLDDIAEYKPDNPPLYDKLVIKPVRYRRPHRRQ